MELDDFRTLGRSGLRVSPLCLGAMTFGSTSIGDGDAPERILDRYTEAGGNFIDTANGYSNGRSEQIIGEHLTGKPGLRDRLVIATKFSGNLFPGDPNGGGGGRKAIMQQVEASLRRLRTDYVDLYWQHNFDRHTPIEETMATLDDLVRAGKLRYVGLSDSPAWAVARAATLAQWRGWAPVAAIQVEYSLLERTVEGELFGAVHDLGLGVTPWSPLAGGVLSGKYQRGQDTVDGQRARMNGHRLTDNAYTLIDTLARIGTELDTTVAAAALAWVRQQGPVTSTIIGARTLDQLDANLDSLHTQLTEAHLAELDELSTPTLDFPARFLTQVAVSYQQAGATVNGVTSRDVTPPEVRNQVAYVDR